MQQVTKLLQLTVNMKCTACDKAGSDSMKLDVPSSLSLAAHVFNVDQFMLKVGSSCGI